jgi:hypothetical protein
LDPEIGVNSIFALRLRNETVGMGYWVDMEEIVAIAKVAVPTPRLAADGLVLRRPGPVLSRSEASADMPNYLAERKLHL